MAKYGSFKYGTRKYGTGNRIFIFDRTERDILNNTPKAYLNYTDLNRIEQNCAYVVSVLNEMGYKVNYEVRTWELNEIPKQSELNRICQCLKDIVAVFGKYDNVPYPPSNLNKPTYIQINNVEKFLYYTLVRCTYVKRAYAYSGEIYSGE